MENITDKDNIQTNTKELVNPIKTGMTTGSRSNTI
jgi:hypothetical protein